MKHNNTENTWKSQQPWMNKNNHDQHFMDTPALSSSSIEE